MRKIEFADDEIYHVYNRGVEKRDIFEITSDYKRFIHDLYEFNDDQRVLNLGYRYNCPSKQKGEPDIILNKSGRIPIVEILVFTLMPNHYHLLLRQKKPDGITRFMHKLGTGYTMYFNKKYQRSGCLFQGPFKAVHVNDEAHLIHLPHYIHTNPYRGLASIKTLKDLQQYRWSSFSDYLGHRLYRHIITRQFLLNSYGGQEGYIRYTKNHIEAKPR
ncbi:MAG: transposase [Nitrospira sp.]|nr:transposase [bacterium]MBL7049841.1 transposase [Nitrospira sp.]